MPTVWLLQGDHSQRNNAVWLVDQVGRLWTVGDVAPGEPARAAEAYRSPVRFGQLGLQHADLSRSRVIA